MPALMVQGCTSWAGKSWLVTALCRWLARQGVDVAPFKAQNMSNNARVCADGGEIGVAQWLQAQAARVEPDVRMNPVLLKPQGGTSQVVVGGRVDHELSALPWRGRSARYWPAAQAALDHLLAAHDVVVIEGAGSPAETNLADDDIVNMRTAAHADAPVLLVADIDRGGAFAHLYGTWALVGDEHRDRIVGFVLNRFRGDASLLAPAPAELQARTGVPTLGVIPMLEHDLPDEDGADAPLPHRAGTRPRVAVVRYPTASNLDEFRLCQQVAELSWASAPKDLQGADLVVLPGSRHVLGDLAWLRRTGIDEALRHVAAAGTPVLGICGGLQLLGGELDDPFHVDGLACGDRGHRGRGLGLLPLTTTFARDKTTVATTARFRDVLPAPWASVAGRVVHGYEIRHGRTRVDGDAVPALPDGLGWASGSVLGVYVHGLLEDPAVLTALFGDAPTRSLESTFEALADAVDAHLDTDLLRRQARIR